GSFTTVTAPDGTKIANFSASGELWKNNLGSCGIGTICHEFSHSLGLPDIYPTTNDAGYSVVDEWDLMDGGNFTNYGWCPPDYSPLEKMLFGWLTPVELTEPATIKNMKTLADGGDVYIIKKTEDNYYLLENRQWQGWSLGVPGRGLVIYHVDYLESKWSSNSVNNVKGAYRYELVHADGLDYDAWDNLLELRDAKTKYINKTRMNCLYLSTSPFPWTTDSTATVDQALTDTETPITNIRMTDDGLVSFDFRGGDQSGITPAVVPSQRSYYDLMGRRVTGRPGKGIYIIEGKKVIIQ
ncbi:MAG: immune inhibitor A, partial [Prevotella sp.]|nr:immune inhibitor A [Prevotella sp.]